MVWLMFNNLKPATKHLVSFLKICLGEYLQLKKKLEVLMLFLTITAMHQSKM